MTETSSGEVPTASLVGALAVFPLNDVLGLLAETGQRGELQVVGHGVDGHLWIDSKDLVGATLEGANTLTQAVFELMLLDEGWFYFTSDQVPPAGQVQHQSVTSVINEVVPQVQEWRDLLSRVPLDAEVRMAPTTPGPEVQIRADQWRVLTTVGTGGRTVSSVVEQLEDDNVVIVRSASRACRRRTDRDLDEGRNVAVPRRDDRSRRSDCRACARRDERSWRSNSADRQPRRPVRGR